jgi:hypothetical protein
MNAIELEVPVINHRLDAAHLQLPAHVTRAKLVVLYEELPEQRPGADIDGILASSRGVLGSHSIDEINAQLQAMRDEWDGDWDTRRP